MVQGAKRLSSRKPWLGETDVWLLRQGQHLRPWEKLGAHPHLLDGVAGTWFAVWAPHARQVAVVGDFNHWNDQQHVMQRVPGAGIWELFVPGVAEGALYKFAVSGADGRHVFKTDPYALRTEQGGGHAAIVMALPGPVARAASQRGHANA